MRNLISHLLLIQFCLLPLGAEEPIPSIKTEGDWTTMTFMTTDKLKIDYVYQSDGSVIVSIFHFFDRDAEKPVTFSENLEVEGATLEDLSNPPMQIGYRNGNLEFAQSICRLIPDDPEAEQVGLPEHVFSHMPEYWPFVLPYPIFLQKAK